VVVAQTPEDFAAWRASQLQPAPDPVTAEAKRGLDLMETRCGLCHEVRGTRAGAVSGPDLTHLMSRRTIAAGQFDNNTGNLAGWIEVSQAMKPGSLMPNQQLSGQQISDELAYLETLQ
jgi:cytochrome c oxidase subunit II